MWDEVQGQLSFHSAATVIITSNKHPSDIFELKDSEYVDKFIYVPFTEVVKDYDAFLFNETEKYLTQLYLWGLSCPIY